MRLICQFSLAIFVAANFLAYCYAQTSLTMQQQPVCLRKPNSIFEQTYKNAVCIDTQNENQANSKKIYQNKPLVIEQTLLESANDLNHITVPKPTENVLYYSRHANYVDIYEEKKTFDCYNALSQKKVGFGACRYGEMAIPAAEFLPEFQVVHAEWFYELMFGYKHSFLVLQTQNGSYFVTEKTFFGIFWYLAESKNPQITPYGNENDKGWIPDDIRLIHKEENGSFRLRNDVFLYAKHQKTLQDYVFCFAKCSPEKLALKKTLDTIAITIGDLKLNSMKNAGYDLFKSNCHSYAGWIFQDLKNGQWLAKTLINGRENALQHQRLEFSSSLERLWEIFVAELKQWNLYMLAFQDLGALLQWGLGNKLVFFGPLLSEFAKTFDSFVQ